MDQDFVVRINLLLVVAYINISHEKIGSVLDVKARAKLLFSFLGVQNRVAETRNALVNLFRLFMAILLNETIYILILYCS